MQYKWTVLTVTSVGVLMSGIDSRIMIVGLPEVAAALHADAEQAVWFTQAYVLGATLTMLLIGRTTDMIGRVKIYTAGFAIFTIGSLLVSTSLVPSEVIAFRALQGVGSSMLSVNSTALIVDAVEEKNLGLMLGLNTLAFRAGALSALTLSGVILTFFDWRALFYINIPIGIFGTYWAHRRLKETVVVRRRPSMDWIGYATFTAAVGCFLLGLTFSAYGFVSASVTDPLFLVSFVSFVAFVYQERRVVNPMLDLTLFRIRQFMGGTVALFLNAIAWGAVLILLSLYFQLGRSMSPLQAGLAFLPFEFAYVIVGPLSGKLSDSYGRNYFMAAGLAMQGVAVYLFSTLTQSVSFYYVVVYLVMFGVGSGLFNSPNSSSVMSAVPPERRGIASGTTSAVWNVGYVMSLNVAIIIMTTVVPFSVISGTISSAAAQTSAVNRTLFIEGLRRAYIVLAGLDFVAIVPSVLRGDWRKAAGKDVSLSARDKLPED
jgi:EmrB/QacA subfamily drug resistance transporter